MHFLSVHVDGLITGGYITVCTCVCQSTVVPDAGS